MCPNHQKMTPKSGPDRWLRLEYLLALAAIVVAVLLHWLYLFRAGGLWRDEAGFVGLANLPRWQEVWLMLTHDNCPLLLPAIIRLWCGLGWGGTDFGLRVLGFGIGLLLPVSLWLTCRWMRRGVPLLPLSLVALNVMVIRTEDSLRAYGLGCALNVLALGLIWRVVQKPGRGNIFMAAVAAVLSVQCLYQNAFFILAACAGGFAVCARNRRWRDLLWILGIGLVAAVSLAPYASPIIHSQSWWQLQKMGFDAGAGWRKVSFIMGFPLPRGTWLWVGLCVLAAVFACRRAKAAAAENHDLKVFCAVALWTGIAGFYIFLRLSDLMTPHWYYLPLLAFVAACLDGSLAGCGRWVSPCLCGLTLLATLAACENGFAAMKYRQTNMDLVAKVVSQQAETNDYVIVNPWVFGVSFNRYYHGAAPWTTVPPLEDHLFHRYDLFRLRMQEPHPLQPIFDKLDATLQSGHRVWLVGSLPMSTNPPTEISPAPNEYGWHEWIYSQAWGEQVGHQIITHATQASVFTNLTLDPVSPFEDVNVGTFAGWRAARPRN